ncbi:MAG: sulfite exporter TauE/SafE family protein, partial [Candidatus Limnocylindrales bacterium]
MIVPELLVFIASLAAGGFGAVVGVGGGLVLVPLLSVGLGVPLHNAIAASLLGVICVSTTASGSFLRSGLADRRLGLTLLGATALGGLIGGYVAGFLDARVLSATFGVVLVGVAIQMLRSRSAQVAEVIDEPGRFEFDGSFVEPTTGEAVAYRAR